MTKMPPLRMSHVGIYVHDMDLMLGFYTGVMGLTETDRGMVRGSPIVFTSTDPREHHQIALIGGRPAEIPFNPINQISFRMDSVEILQQMWRRVKDAPGVTDLRPVDHGNAWSVYFRDPEGNRLELFCDTEFYVSQPCLEPLDLSLPAEEIRAKSEAFCRSAPGFRPIADYRAELAAKMGQTAA